MPYARMMHAKINDLNDAVVIGTYKMSQVIEPCMLADILEEEHPLPDDCTWAADLISDAGELL